MHGEAVSLFPMCTAYELGKRGGSFPSFVRARAIKTLMGLERPTLIRPTDPGLVILPDGELATMSWGFRRTDKGKLKQVVKRTVVNTRTDHLHYPIWRDAIAGRRCIVPMAWCYESNSNPKPTRWWRIEKAAFEWMWVAGVWEEDAQFGRVYSTLTTQPNALVAPIHDRMLAILREEEIEPYLRGDLKIFSPSTEDLKITQCASPLKQGSQLDLL